MRIAPLLALLLPLSSFASDDTDFSGAWVGWLCPANVERTSGQCPNFVLELLQRENRLCGAHMFASAGAAEMDEGAAPSFVGTVAGSGATALVISGRGSPPARLRVELTMRDDGALKWERLDNPPGDYLLPRVATMTRSPRKTLFAPLFAHELQAVCALNFNAMLRQSTPPVPDTPQPVR